MAAHVRPVLAANWKMNLTPSQAIRVVDAFTLAFGPREDRTIVIFPSALSFGVVHAAVQGRDDIRLGVQNVHTAEKGAFTGENSAGMARDAGAAFVLVGHSERRHVFGETDEQCAEKVSLVAAHGLTPVLCVGELLEQREDGATDAVVLRQLRAGLAALDADAVRSAIIAYEPVWAIGTGRTATPDDAAAVHRVIRRALVELVGEGAAEIPILYGGSVTAANAAALLAADQVDGLLVGGASLDPDSWAAICSA